MEAFKRKRAKQMQSGFHLIDRELTERERRENPFAAIMTHVVHGDVIVPDILRYPLDKISYPDLMPKIVTANPSKEFDLFVLYDLWDDILSKVYDYEYDWREEKKRDVSLPQRPLSRLTLNFYRRELRASMSTLYIVDS